MVVSVAQQDFLVAWIDLALDICTYSSIREARREPMVSHLQLWRYYPNCPQLRNDC